LDLRYLVEHCLNVVRTDVETFGCNDEVFLSAAIIEAALRVDFAQIPRVQPSLRIRCARDAFAAHQDFSVRRNSNLLTGNRSAQRAVRRRQWMIYRNDRTRFRKSVSLHDCETETRQKFFEIRVETRASCDKRPEFPPELCVNFAIRPPSRRNPGQSAE